MNVKDENNLVNALALAIKNNLSDTSFTNFKKYLHKTEQYYLKCILLDNKFLYNSIVEKAQLLNL